MSLIPYNDYCEITRVLLRADGTPTYNEWDEPMMLEVYAGACRYQPQGWNNGEIASRVSLVYLPVGIVLRKGDAISITDQRGEQWRGVVNSSRVQQMPLGGEVLTKVEIIQESEG